MLEDEEKVDMFEEKWKKVESDLDIESEVEIKKDEEVKWEGNEVNEVVRKMLEGVKEEN